MGFSDNHTLSIVDFADWCALAEQLSGSICIVEDFACLEAPRIMGGFLLSIALVHDLPKFKITRLYS